MLADDLREALAPDGSSPVKCAAQVWRILRDQVRSVVEYRGLNERSYRDFNGELTSRIHRLIAGPPALRSAQLLALVRAGLLSFPYGPSPQLSAAGASRTRITSRELTAGHSDEVGLVIRGHLDAPSIEHSASPLLERLRERGRIAPLRYGATAVGSIELTADAHPRAEDGATQPRIWVFGVPTEGVRHFNHYIPSPRSRSRAVRDIGRCVHEILSAGGAPR
jgi:hypothetical protein